MRTLLTWFCVAVIGLASTQSFGALDGTKDSADFDFKYEMDVDPSTENLDSAGGGSGDWAVAPGTTAPTFDGLMNMNSQWVELHGGSGWGDIFDNPTLDGYNHGYTMELSLKLDIVSTFDMYVQTGAIADSGIRVEIEDSAVHYGAPSGRVKVSDKNTQGEWHTYRLVGHKYSVDADNVWSLWMDGELLMDEVDLGTPVLGDGRRLTIGNVHDIDIQGQVDYFRITSGAWGPVDGTDPVDGPNVSEFFWGPNDSGSWAAAGNWDPTGGPPGMGDPNSAPPYDTVTFGNAITSQQTVFTNSAVSVRDIIFDNANTYAIAGPGSVNLVLATGASPPPTAITVNEGNHQFQVIVNLQTNTTVDVASDATLEFNNRLFLNGHTLTKTGDGILAISNRVALADGTIDVQQGTMSGYGTVGGDVNNVGGTLSPGDSASATSAIPEPSTMLLLLLGGLLGIGLGGHASRPKR